MAIWMGMDGLGGGWLTNFLGWSVNTFLFSAEERKYTCCLYTAVNEGFWAFWKDEKVWNKLLQDQTKKILRLLIKLITRNYSIFHSLLWLQQQQDCCCCLWYQNMLNRFGTEIISNYLQWLHACFFVEKIDWIPLSIYGRVFVARVQKSFGERNRDRVYSFEDTLSACDHFVQSRVDQEFHDFDLAAWKSEKKTANRFLESKREIKDSIEFKLMNCFQQMFVCINLYFLISDFLLVILQFFCGFYDSQRIYRRLSSLS